MCSFYEFLIWLLNTTPYSCVSALNFNNIWYMWKTWNILYLRNQLKDSTIRDYFHLKKTFSPWKGRRYNFVVELCIPLLFLCEEHNRITEQLNEKNTNVLDYKNLWSRHRTSNRSADMAPKSRKKKAHGK